MRHATPADAFWAGTGRRQLARTLSHAGQAQQRDEDHRELSHHVGAWRAPCMRRSIGQYECEGPREVRNLRTIEKLNGLATARRNAARQHRVTETRVNEISEVIKPRNVREICVASAATSREMRPRVFRPPQAREGSTMANVSTATIEASYSEARRRDGLGKSCASSMTQT